MNFITKKIDFPAITVFDIFLSLGEEIAFWKSGDWWNLCFGEYTSESPEDVSTDRERSKDTRAKPLFTRGKVGFFSYDFGRNLQNVPGKNGNKAPDFEWRNYERCLSGNEKTGEMFLHCPEKEEREVQKMIFDTQTKNRDSAYKLEKFDELHSKAVWEKGFEKTKENIFAGEIYQLNLARQFCADFTGNSRALFLDLIRKNPAPHAAFFAGKGYEILSLSPELFLRFNGEKVMTEPIKGTRPRRQDKDEDEDEKKSLLESGKEAAELLMITDLLRNDLKQTCQAGSIHLESLREVQKNPTVWHTLSRISGIRKPEYSPIDTLFSCLPGGSISGCPKKRACELIEELEPRARGPFCGVFGFLDDSENGEFSILIRTLIHTHGKMYFQAGGGLTADSEKEAEFEEVMQKGKVFFEWKS